MDKILHKKIQKLIYFGGILLLVCLVFFTLKYLDVYKVLMKTLGAIIPVFIAIIISFLVEPIILKLIHFKIKRVFSVLIVYFLLFGIFVGMVALIFPLVIKNFGLFLNKLPDILKELEKFLSQWVKVNINLDFSKLIPPIDNAHLKNIMEIATKTFDLGFYLSLIVVGAIFLSFDYQNFKKGIKALLPKKYKKVIEEYLMEFLPFIHKYIKGLLIDSVFVSLMGLIVFFLFGFKDALFFALLLGITNCIPLFGPYISGIPIVVMSFLTSTQEGFTALLIIVFLQVIDGNIVQPVIMKNVIYLHPLENILGISILTTLFGLVGMILSPIIVTSIKILIKHIQKYKKTIEIKKEDSIQE